MVWPTVRILMALASLGFVSGESGAQGSLTDSGPTRTLIDLDNGNRWMGCTCPDDPDVDAVLLTHPHYDHDASSYTGEGVPVFAELGSFRAGDVELGVV